MFSAQNIDLRNVPRFRNTGANNRVWDRAARCSNVLPHSRGSHFFSPRCLRTSFAAPLRQAVMLWLMADKTFILPWVSFVDSPYYVYAYLTSMLVCYIYHLWSQISYCSVCFLSSFCYEGYHFVLREDWYLYQILCCETISNIKLLRIADIQRTIIYFTRWEQKLSYPNEFIGDTSGT